MYYISWNNVVYLVYFNEITQEQGQHILFFFPKTNLNNFSLNQMALGHFSFCMPLQEVGLTQICMAEMINYRMEANQAERWILLLGILSSSSRWKTV